MVLYLFYDPLKFRSNMSLYLLSVIYRKQERTTASKEKRIPSAKRRRRRPSFDKSRLQPRGIVSKFQILMAKVG